MIMEENDLRILVSIEDRVIAEDIQNMLEESEIYTLLVSDNPASSPFASRFVHLQSVYSASLSETETCAGNWSSL